MIGAQIGRGAVWRVLMNFWNPDWLPLYISLPPSVSRPLCSDPVTERQRLAELNVYLRALVRELRGVAPEFDDYPIACVTLSAASPSVLHEQSDLPLVLADLQRLFKHTDDCRMLLRVDPEGPKHLCRIRNFLPENTRTELRVLSYSAEELSALKRPYAPEDVEGTLSALRLIGLAKDPCVTLLLGNPGQTLASLKETLEKAISQEFGQVRLVFWNTADTHLIRELYPQEKRAFLQAFPKAEKSFLTEAFDLAADLLEENGYTHLYNHIFARPDLAAKPDLLAMQTAAYLGIGAGAATFLGGNGYRNTENLAIYEKAPDSFEAIVGHFLILEERDLLKRGAIRLLASSTGLSAESFRAVYPSDPSRLFRDPFARLITEGFVREKEGSFFLTRKGLCYLDELAGML